MGNPIMGFVLPPVQAEDGHQTGVVYDSHHVKMRKLIDFKTHPVNTNREKKTVWFRRNSLTKYRKA